MRRLRGLNSYRIDGERKEVITRLASATNGREGVGERMVVDQIAGQGETPMLLLRLVRLAQASPDE